MKKISKNLIIAFIALTVLTVSQSCIKEEFDKPPINIPTVDFNSNTTIAELKAMFTGNLDSITTDIIIQGIVIANDESGNIYKSLYIRDNTGGIEIRLDQTDLYNEYRIGQRVFVKCKGMYIGKYGGVQQLGYIFNNSVGRLPAILIPNHLFRDSLPGPNPVPINLKIADINSSHIGNLIKIDSVYFESPGVIFSEPTSTTNRNLVDFDNNKIIVRTSNYANFAANLMPEGVGNVVAILSSFNGELQLYIRDLNDLRSFNTNVPYPQNIFFDNFDSAPTADKWTIFSIASNRNWSHNTSDRAMTVNGFNGDVASNDWLITSAINLPANAVNPILTFRSWTRYTDAANQFPMKPFISTNYTGSGDPSLATWTELSATLPVAHSQTWTSSGNIDLSTYLGQTFYIGFRYISSGTGSNSSSEWKLDDVNVRATL